jgi:D-alanyl-D-alanine carboxypeptidase (penicillin-binding protein 5/6)
MIDNENYIIDSERLMEEDEVSQENKFPVKRQLLIVGVLLFFIFAGFVVPKSFALLNPTTNQAELPSGADSIKPETPVTSPQKFSNVEIRAEAAYVWDVVGQRALFQKNADKPLPLASVTKLMTALVSYELVSDDTLVTISEAAAAQQSGGSFTAGEIFKAKELADFALISSYNSAAYTLADSVGALLGNGDSVTQFVAAMNIKAEEMELKSLRFSNPTGLDISTTVDGAAGSARDVSFLVEYILTKHPEILAPTVLERGRLYNTKGVFHEADNTNNILTSIPNLLGSKTGYTDLAGGNLTVAFDGGFNRPIIITVLGSTWSERFSDVKKLVAETEKSLRTEI